MGDLEHLKVLHRLAHQQVPGPRSADGNRDLVHQDAILVLLQRVVQAQVNPRKGHPQIEIQRAPHLRHLGIQALWLDIAPHTGGNVDDQRNRQGKADGFHLLDRVVVIGGKAGRRHRGRSRRSQRRHAAAVAFIRRRFAPPRDIPPANPRQRGQEQKGQRRKAGNQRKAEQDEPRDHQRLGFVHQLRADIGAQVLRLVIRGDPRDDEPRRDRHEQRGDLADKPVTDGQQRIAIQRVAHRHALLRGADDDPSDQVDEDDDDRGDGIALHEFHRPVHRPVKLAFRFQLRPPRLCGGQVDQPRPHVAVDRHLLARHRIQREPRRNLGHPFRTLGDHDEVHDGQDQEDDHPDDKVPLDHEVPEGFHDMAGIRLKQDQPRRGDRQRKPEQRGQ